MRERLVNRTLNPRLSILPAKFQTFPEHQRQAVTEIVAAFDQGSKLVVVEAPTGSGKTVIAEAVRLMLGVDGAYVCHSKTLQDQFVREFDYAGVLYGRNNYIPIHPIMDATCDDCTKDCGMCPLREECPYQLAKMGAIRAPVAVINSALWLSATQTPNHWLSRRGLTVFDEADTLEPVLMSQAEIVIGPYLQKKYGIKPPAKMTTVDSYGDWAATTVECLRRAYRGLRGDSGDIKVARERRRLTRLMSNIELLQTELKEGNPWVYTGGAGSARRTGEYISFKPVTVESLGQGRIWQHSPRFLLMSGTVVSASMLLRALGHQGDYAEVRVPSQFHPKNRQVIVRPVQDMTKNGQTNGLTPALDVLERILNDHPNDRILIHTVSYTLAKTIQAVLEQSHQTAALEQDRRLIVTYADAGSRAAALDEYLSSPNAVLVASSLDRGVDLYDDRCRVQVIAKTPFLSLGDKQVSARLYSDGGKVWYNVEVARTIMQMVGRGVRHQDDYCTTYILDSHFLKWRRAWGHLFPEWFNRAIRVEAT